MIEDIQARFPFLYTMRADCYEYAMLESSLDAPDSDIQPTGSTWTYDTFGVKVITGKGARFTQADFDRCFPAEVSVKKEYETKPRGGKRVGSGRRSLDEEGTIVTTVRLTGKQKATFNMIGGSVWLRGQLDLFSS